MATPICDDASGTCVPCDGDLGSSAKDPCFDAAAPTCALSGSSMGQCGKCATDADCTGHAGPVCDATSGACIVACDTDAQCASSQWCDPGGGMVGSCVPKLPNGTVLPMTPATVAKCSMAVGMRVCLSGVCDPADNTCGLADGDGPCASNADCRDGSCDPTTRTCTPPPSCTKDEDCKAGDFCKMGACLPQLPSGAACTAATQCQSGACEDGVCNDIVGVGSGLCATQAPGGGGGAGGGAALAGLLLAACGLARRRR
jgi:hypothetical protein